MPTRFLFWNINKNRLAQPVAWLAEDHRIDVIVLAESGLESIPGFDLLPGPRRSVQIYMRAPNAAAPRFDSDHVSIVRLALPGRSEVLLAGVHLPSKQYWSNQSQYFGCGELSRQIVHEESRAGHRRTVLVGDFNMNPFEEGMIGAGGLHAVMSRAVAARIARSVHGQEYPFFYNPMWAHMHDALHPSAGSYFYTRSEYVDYFWHTFDQVLIRPELIDGFDPGTLGILTTAGARSLVRADGRPDSTNFSDHLPIVFELKF